MEENNKHVQPNSKEEGVQRLNRILSESLIKATDTYKTPPQIIWVDNSSIATLGNFSASTGKAKAKKTFNVSALVAASLSPGSIEMIWFASMAGIVVVISEATLIASKTVAVCSSTRAMLLL